MKFEMHSAPHIRSSNNNRRIMFDIIAMLLVLYFVATYYYGTRVLLILATTLLTCGATHIISSLIINKKVNVRDYSPVVTSLIIGLLMPIGIPLYVIIVANIFATFLAKHPFGGTGQNIFNPAACGIALVTITFSNLMFSYRAPFLYSGTATTKSLAYNMFIGGIPKASHYDILVGNVPAPIGTAYVYLLIACMLYLVVRKTIRFSQVALTLISLSTVAYFFPRIDATGLESVFYEVCAMPTLFFVTFMFTDPVTSPARNTATNIYAVLSGIVIMIFRHLSVFEISEPFALLVLNFMVPTIDCVVEFIHTKIRRANFAKRQRQRQHEFINNN